jgi:glycosyltransferase involved in cell wall biosynthesis
VRILLDYRPALRQRTGVGEYVHELARALVATAPAAGESLTLFSASWRDRLSPTVVPGCAVLDRAIPVRLLNYGWHRLGWPPVEILAGAPFDVVHSFHPLLMPSRTAAQVVTVHDLDFLDHPERTTAEIRRDYPALAAAHARRADGIVVNSASTGREVESRFAVPAAKITVCYPGAPDWPARGEDPSDGCLLFMGTIEPRKNLDVLVEAYERTTAAGIDPPPLVLAGRHTDASGAVLQRIRRSPVAHRIELPGYVDEATRQSLYRRATLLLLPSLTEGFGMPALEAMTVGVPVIASNRGALPEVVGSAGRLFEPDDPQALARAIADLLRHPDLRARMREDGWRQARRFQWTSSARKLRDAWAAAVEVKRRA